MGARITARRRARRQRELRAGLADLIKVSDEDLHMLFKGQSDANALAEIRAMDPKATVLVTRGSGTASLYASSEVYDARPPSVVAAVTVGADDASIGGLLFSLMGRRGGWPEHLKPAQLRGQLRERAPEWLTHQAYAPKCTHFARSIQPCGKFDGSNVRSAPFSPT
ncbi:PfkB family carbohydrate kinase [Caballeronia hypogeia]|uniref:PfkB family carbohydrate kinase n=1 Tax=Caballeronia hypogeia TaxID=1777140 RepID=A0A158CX93_9BURK|nr:PfkB family carbohydrate kinase [Caballeronia hypogeia]